MKVKVKFNFCVEITGLADVLTELPLDFLVNVATIACKAIEHVASWFG